jgi:hypothetical protein
VPVYPASSVVTFNKKVMIVLPWHKQVSPMTSFCVSQLIDRRRTATMLNFGDAFVAHSRNTCADIFLQSPSDWVLMVDDDMILPFGNAEWFNAYTRFNLPEKFAGLNAIDRLMSHGKTLVGGLYFGRYHNAKAVYNEAMSHPQEAEFARTAPIDLVKPTKWVGTGCLLAHRSVFEDIEKRFPRLARGHGKKGGQWFTSTEASIMEQLERTKQVLTGPLTSEKAYKALEMVEGMSAIARHENALGCGEDVSFCLRASAAGHQPHVDMGLVCGHIGHCVFGPHNTGPGA